MNSFYQRVRDADEIDDAVTVRIWRIDGSLVGEANHPTIQDAQTGRVITAALGNPVAVEKALSNAWSFIQQTPFETICVEIDDEKDWDSKWGELRPVKEINLSSKPFRG